MICAAGHYEETKWRAIAEAGINLTVSLALVRSLGIVGVLLGTLASYGYRTFDVIFYNSRYLVKGVWKRSIRRILVNLLAAGICLILWGVCPKPYASGYLSWAADGVICGALAVCLIFLVNWAAEPVQMKLAIEKLRGILGVKRRREAKG